MKIETDWHIHSHNSCDNASLSIVEIIRFTSLKGIKKFGIADHLNTRINLPDIERSRKEFLVSIVSCSARSTTASRCIAGPTGSSTSGAIRLIRPAHNTNLSGLGPKTGIVVGYCTSCPVCQ